MSRVFSPSDPDPRAGKIKWHSPVESGELCQACTRGRESRARWHVMTHVGTRKQLVSVCRHCSERPGLQFWRDHVPETL